VAEAFRERIKAIELIEYNFYIDNMPIKGLNILTETQKDRIFNLMTNKKCPDPKADTKCQEIMNFAL